jgi:transposase
VSHTRFKKKAPKSQRRDLRLDQLKAILDRARTGPLSSEDHATLTAAVDTLAFLTQELEAKGTTIDRLRRMLFGASTEKTSTIFGEAAAGGGHAPAVGTPVQTNAAATADTAGSAGATGTQAPDKPKAPGHGRNGAAAYIGAEKIKVPHTTLHSGDLCPACQKGKLYPLPQPALLLRVRAMAPLVASRYELDRLRCNACGEVFTAETPEGVGPDKYDETAAAMIGLLRYGSGLPFNRIARLERGFGIPLPPPTQWGIVERAAGLMTPAFQELIRQAAQAKVVHNDDTKMKVLELMAAARRDADEADDDERDKPAGERTGIFTSGIVADDGTHPIALFFTGHQHAGENLADVLARRAAELPPPIQMCDALAANTAGELHTIVANCIAHARRNFVDVANNFPDACRHVLDQLGLVYKNDALARTEKMTDQARLAFHIEHSKPIMDDLKAWMEAQLAEHKVEPNSGLGDAIDYMLKHWPKLTLFLHQPGAPLDNSLCERAIKKAICHRKNSLFYKTLHGAHVGDMFMSFIHTAELCGAPPFDYLVALQRHHDQVAEHPADWMPWNYHEALARLTSDTEPPR